MADLNARLEGLQDTVADLAKRLEDLEEQLGGGPDTLTDLDFRCPSCGLTARSFSSKEAAQPRSTSMPRHTAGHDARTAIDQPWGSPLTEESRR